MLYMNFIERNKGEKEGMSIIPRAGNKTSETNLMQNPITVKQKGQMIRYLGDESRKKVAYGQEGQNLEMLMSRTKLIQNNKGEQNIISGCVASNSYSGFNSKELSSEQRRIIQSISKIFMSQKPKPKRILVRLNEMQRKCDQQYQWGESAGSCRIDNISITRLPEEGDGGISSLEQQINLKTRSEFPDCPEIAGVIVNFNSDQKNRKRISSPCIVNQSVRSSVSLDHCKKRQILRLQKTVAIKYLPDSGCNMSQEGRSTTHQVFTRFRRGKQQLALSRSFASEDLLQELMSEQGQKGEGGFTRLTEVDLFAKRRQLQRNQNVLTNKANELLSQQHMDLKNQFDIERQILKGKLKQSTEIIEKMQRESDKWKEVEVGLRGEAEMLGKKVGSLRELNEVYLRENNNLKEKMKQYEKTIQDLRKELISRQAYSTSGNPKDSHIENQQQQYLIQSYPKPIQFGKRAISPKVKLQRYSTVEGNPLRINSIQLNEQNMVPASINSLTDRSQNKLVNVRSVKVIPRPSLEGQSNDRDPSNENSVASHRTGGIRKNNLRKEGPALQPKNLVRVKSTDMEQESYGGYISRDRREQNSVSNYSNTSGKSLSQRIGYINRPSMVQARKGMFVDYMLQGVDDNMIQKQLQNQVEEKKSVVQKQKQRFRYNGKK